MAGLSDKELALAQVYSTAMLELAESKGEADSLLEELLALAALVEENAELDAFFSSPTVDPDSREKSIERIFRGRASDLLVDSVQILNRKGRLGLFRGVAETYRVAHQELRGRVEVNVTTAVPLTDSLRARIKGAIGEYAGKEAMLVEEVDESIIGGVILQIGDEKFDAGLASRLVHLGKTLSDRASKEIHGDRSHVA